MVPKLVVSWEKSELIESARGIVSRLQRAGHQAYFVGGAVRNWLAGAAIQDIDIATSAHPEMVLEIFAAAKSVGAHFGVTLVRCGGHTFEVATFRAEGSYVDRRRPSEVRFGTLEEDWRRRDFTVNAIYYDPVAEKLVDPAGGHDHLKKKLLRTVGEPRQRFEEDALRLMRAVRFAVRYELELESATAAAIRAEAAGLAEISIERVGEELIKILTGPHPGRAMKLMGELGLWPYVIPEIVPMIGCEQPANYHPEGDVFVHTALVLENLKEGWEGEPPAELALGALLHDVGKPPTFEIGEDRIRFPEHQRVGAEMALEICKRLKLSTRMTDTVCSLVDQHMRFMDAPRMKRSTLRQFLGQPDFDMHLALHKADCLGSHRHLENYEFCIEQKKVIEAADAEAALLPKPLVTGDDLIAMGLKPGPRFGELLDAVREQQLEGEIASRESALDYLRQKIGT